MNEKVNDAARETEIAKLKEQVDLAIKGTMVKKDYQYNKDEAKAEIKKISGVTVTDNEDGTLTVIKGGITVSVDKEGNTTIERQTVESTASLIANNINMQLQNNETVEGVVNIQVTYDTNVKLGGKVLSNSDRFQYKIGNNVWQTATERQIVNTAGDTTVYARYFDGANGYKETSLQLVNNELVFMTNTQADQQKNITFQQE